MQNGRMALDFCKDWKFKRDDHFSAQYASFDDSGWEWISIPHDWSIFGPFDINCPIGARGGFLPMGIGWYRKKFKTPEYSFGKKTVIEFDGIFRHATVYVNGIKMGFRPNGYVPQSYDISDYLFYDGKDNILAVKVDNSDQPGHRYYCGSGIYRKARLVITDKLHMEHAAPFVTTEKVKDDMAVVNVQTVLKNDSVNAKQVSVKYELFDRNSDIAAELLGEAVTIKGGQKKEFTNSLEIKNPHLWSCENPYLYTLVTTVYGKNGILDTSVERIGIRTIEYNADEGFLLNGKKVFMKGVCLHHDNGCLGAVANASAERRKLEIMKEMGCNAIRLSHNPFSKEFLNLCDEMGMLVMDEAFDEWRLPKCVPMLNPKDKRYRSLIHNYYMDFEKWHKADLEAMLYRDRNHPSIVIWSIGNEIPEQRQNVYEGYETALKLAKIVKSIDTTRPITCACCFGDDGRLEADFPNALDVIGYNYGDTWYEQHEAFFPHRPFIGTETTSLPWFKKRGHYDPHLFSHKDGDASYFGGEVLEDRDFYRITAAERSYMRHKKSKAVAGLFIWTGMDYFGEPTPHLWPSRSSYFGTVDTAGFKKDGFYFYQSQWSDKNVVHIAGHWNWQGKENELIDVMVFTNCDYVELFLNNVSQGIRYYDKVTCEHLLWQVPYAPGKLKAVGYKNSQKCAEDYWVTAYDAQKITIRSDKTVFNGRDDLIFVTAEITDHENNMIPTGEYEVLFEVEDGLEIKGVDNGDPEYIGSLKTDKIPSLAGKCLAVIACNKPDWKFKIKASFGEVKSNILEVESKTW